MLNYYNTRFSKGYTVIVGIITKFFHHPFKIPFVFRKCTVDGSWALVGDPNLHSWMVWSLAILPELGFCSFHWLYSQDRKVLRRAPRGLCAFQSHCFSPHCRVEPNFSLWSWLIIPANRVTTFFACWFRGYSIPKWPGDNLYFHFHGMTAVFPDGSIPPNGI